MMNKNTRTLLVVAASLVVTGGLILGAAWVMGVRPAQFWQISLPWQRTGDVISLGSYFPDYKDMEGGYRTDGVYDLSPSDISGLDIKWVAGSADVKVYDGKDIKFIESCGDHIEESDALRWGVEYGTLYIQYCQRRTDGDLPLKSLEVFLPESLAEDMTSFDADVISAEVTTSGIKSSTFSFNSVSGALNASDVDADFIETNSVSGALFLKGAFDDITVNTTSGKVNVTSEVCPERLNIGSVSGDVSLTLPPDSGFTLDYDTVSGSLTCDFAVTMKENDYMCGDGSADFDINTVSGGLEMKIGG